MIGHEIRLVGEQELDELDRLAVIERYIGSLLNEYAALAQDRDAARAQADWNQLSHILDQRIDRDFNVIIQEAINHEAEEVREARETTARQMALFRIVAIVCGCIAVAAAFVSLWLIVGKIRRPISNLLAGAHAFSAGDFAHRVAVGGHGELAEVCHAFNRMADEIARRTTSLSEAKTRLEQAVTDRTAELTRALSQLETHERHRRRLLADVSHELRTPLTIIQGEADIALRGRQEKSADVYREALAKARDAARHTARIVDDLLLIARREAGEVRLERKQVDLATLLPNVIDEYRSLADGRGGDIVFHDDTDKAVIRVDPDRLRQVLVILMENALRYGQNTVEVRLSDAPGGFAIAVIDGGPGLSEEEQERAFQRFFRGTNAAALYAGGSGLGLPIAKAIVEAHGGRISLESEPGKGTTVSLILFCRRDHNLRPSHESAAGRR